MRDFDDIKNIDEIEMNMNNPILWRNIVYATLLESSRNFNRIPFAMLMILHHCGRPMPAKEIADRMRVSANTVSQQMQRLVHEGYVMHTGVQYNDGKLRTHYKPTSDGLNFLHERLVCIAREAFKEKL